MPAWQKDGMSTTYNYIMWLHSPTSISTSNISEAPYKKLLKVGDKDMRLKLHPHLDNKGMNQPSFPLHPFGILNNLTASEH